MGAFSERTNPKRRRILWVIMVLILVNISISSVFLITKYRVTDLDEPGTPIWYSGQGYFIVVHGHRERPTALIVDWPWSKSEITLDWVRVRNLPAIDLPLDIWETSQMEIYMVVFSTHDELRDYETTITVGQGMPFEWGVWHVFHHTGDYTIRVTAYDQNGVHSSLEETITIVQAPQIR